MTHDPANFENSVPMIPGIMTPARSPQFLAITHYNKPATHCLCLQIGVGLEHSWWPLQPEKELFLETFTRKTLILDVIKNSQFLWLGITVYDHPQFLDIISNLRQHISQCVDYIFLLEVCNLSQGNQNIFQK